MCTIAQNVCAFEDRFDQQNKRYKIYILNGKRYDVSYTRTLMEYFHCIIPIDVSADMHTGTRHAYHCLCVYLRRVVAVPVVHDTLSCYCD